jgi:hypothetical protein
MLTGVIGNFALLELVLDKDSDAYKMAENSKRAADQSKDLAKQLLTFAKGGLRLERRFLSQRSLEKRQNSQWSMPA